MNDKQIYNLAIWADKIAYEHGIGILDIINRFTSLYRLTGDVAMAKAALEQSLK